MPKLIARQGPWDSMRPALRMAASLAVILALSLVVQACSRSQPNYPERRPDLTDTFIEGTREEVPSEDSVNRPTPKAERESSTKSPTADAIAPAKSDAPPPLLQQDETASGPRVFQATRFRMTVSDKWVESRGNYSGDFGAILSITPEATADGRAIDIFREAVPIPRPLVSKAYVDYWKNFATKLGTTTTLDVVGEETIGERLVSRAIAKNSAHEARIQHFIVWASEDGIYVFVLSTRTANAATDLVTLKECVASLTFGDLEAVRAATRATLPYTFGRPRGWLLTVSGQRALLRAPMLANQDGTIYPIQTSLTITTVGRANVTAESQATFVKQLAVELDGRAIDDKLKAEQAQQPTWGVHGGLTSATLAPSTDTDIRSDTPYRKVIVIFGLRHTFIVTLNSSHESKSWAETELTTFLSLFSEAAAR